MLVKIITSIVVLSVIILIHELGHFIASKLIGVKVEEFGLGYPPRAIGKKIGETIYSLNWLPFGGFVRIFGEQEAEAPNTKSKRAFFNKSKKQRSVVILAGVFMNLVLAVFCFSLIYSIVGIPEEVDYLVVQDVDKDSKAFSQVLENGDKIIAINSINVNTFEEYKKIEEELSGTDVDMMIERENEEQTVRINNFDNPVMILGLEDDSPADKAGMEVGDRIEKIDGQTVNKTSDIIDYSKTKNGDDISIDLTRGDKEIEVSLTLREKTGENRGAMGVFIGNELSVYNVDNIFYPKWQMPFRGSVVGFQEAFSWTKMMIFGLGTMIKESFQGIKPQVSGIIGVIKATSSAVDQGFLAVIKFTGIFSINLAVVNMLPIPALDGGRFLFIVFEKAIGRKMKPKLEATINTIGFMLLVGLMILITVGDVLRLIRK